MSCHLYLYIRLYTDCALQCQSGTYIINNVGLQQLYNNEIIKIIDNKLINLIKLNHIVCVSHLNMKTYVNRHVLKYNTRVHAVLARKLVLTKEKYTSENKNKVVSHRKRILINTYFNSFLSHLIQILSWQF